jgi:membrane protease YdiL (CAAX protease family)
MTSEQTTAENKPWGRFSTLALGVVALLIAQTVAILALVWWYGLPFGQLPDFSRDGAAVTLIILVSTPIQVGLLMLFARWRGGSAMVYLGLTLPRRSEVVFGIAAVVAAVVVGDVVSWLIGHGVVTAFQNDILHTASAAGWVPLLWLWLAVVVATPICEEILFRGFLFRGWLRMPRDVWPVIVLTALIWALTHVQYDWYVTGQVFAFGLLLGWIRWASGSTLLTILLHGLINFEGMLETLVAQKWLS